MNKKTDLDKLEEILKNNRPKSHYETYQSEITEYMTSKLAAYDVPMHTIMEIAQYCFSCTLLVANDEVRRAYRNWTKKTGKGR